MAATTRCRLVLANEQNLIRMLVEEWPRRGVAIGGLGQGCNTSLTHFDWREVKL